MQILTLSSRSADRHTCVLSGGAEIRRCCWHPGDCPPCVCHLQRQQGQLPLTLHLFAGRTAHRERTGQGELEVGIGCIPDSISKYLEHSEENALQEMNTPQVLVEKKPHSDHLVHNSSGQVITGLFSLIFLNRDLILDHFAVDIWGLSSSFT